MVHPKHTSENILGISFAPSMANFLFHGAVLEISMRLFEVPRRVGIETRAKVRCNVSGQ
jgi:hypothetical protein